MSEVHLYSAYYSTNKYPFRFEISEIKIKSIHGDTIETDFPYFTMKDYSTHFFGGIGGTDLDTEYCLGFGYAYYSTSKEKCTDWLVNKYKEEHDRIVDLYNAITESRIVDKGVEAV